MTDKEQPVLKKKRILEVYTDGSFRRPNFGAFGWAAFENGELILDHVEKVKDTTINRMELSAILHAISSLEPEDEITIYTDSQYARNSCAQWMHGWARRNWMTPLMQPVQNRDIIEQILNLDKDRKITYIWVRGHNGNEKNEIVDKMVQTATKEMVEEDIIRKKEEAAAKAAVIRL